MLDVPPEAEHPDKRGAFRFHEASRMKRFWPLPGSNSQSRPTALMALSSPFTGQKAPGHRQSVQFLLRHYCVVSLATIVRP